MATAVCPSQETLYQYSIGILNGRERDDLDEHLDSCPDCQATIMSLDDADDTVVGRLRMPPSDSFMDEPQLQAALKAAMELPLQQKWPFSPSEPSAEMRKTLGEYQILEELGRGGMGRVYKARHTKLNRVVAVKLLARPKLGDPQAISRFEREMEAVGLLDHPNIVQAHDAREIDDMPVLIMEFIDGLDLAELVRRVGPLPVADTCELIRRTALALQYAHEHGLVHRDIKPSNIMLSKAGEVKLLDLGLARFYVEAVAGEEMTGSGQAMGTADYMAPEQASDSRTVDIRADIYSLGCTLYKLVSGRAPFSGPEYRGTLDKMNAHVHETPSPIGQFVPDLPSDLAAIVDRMLAKNPDDRFTTPAEVAAALEPFNQGADLSELISRAISLPVNSWVKAEKTQDANFFTPRTAPNHRRPIVKYLLIGMGFFGAIALSFGAGILMTIKRNGETQQLNVPNNSETTIDERGNATVTVVSGQQTPHVEYKYPAQKAAGESESSNLDKDQFKVFTLIHADAAAMVKLLAEILDETNPPGPNLRLSVDARNNNIIARGDAKTLQIAEALLLRLDGADTRKPRNALSSEAASSKTAEPKPSSLHTAKITRGDITSTIITTGTIEPEEVVDVSAPVSGKIAELFGDNNSQVEKNQILAKIDDSESKSRLDNELAGLEGTKAKLVQVEAKEKLAKSELDNAKQSNQKVKDTIPQSELNKLATNYEVAQAAVAEAMANVKQSENAVQTAQKNLALTVIKSPIKGVVLKRMVNGGQSVDKETKLFQIAKEFDKMEILINEDERNIVRIREGMAATLFVPTFPTELFKAKVKQIHPHVGGGEVILTFDNPGKKLLPYMSGQVDIEIESRKNVLLVPNAALRWKPKPEEVEARSESVRVEHLQGLDDGLDNLFVLRGDKEAVNNLGRALDPQHIKNRERLWMKTDDGLHVRPIHVQLGISDSTNTEVSGPEVKEGMEVIVGDNKPIESTENPLRPYKYKQNSQPAVVPDEQAIQGTWEVVSSSLSLLRKTPDAKDVPADQISTTAKVIITEDQLKIVGPHVTNLSFAYRLNPNAKSKMIDLQTGSEFNGILTYGIYSLEGDELKICTAPLAPTSHCIPTTGEMVPPEVRIRRPADFWAELGSGKESLVLRRAGKATVSEDEKNILGLWKVEKCSRKDLPLALNENGQVEFTQSMFLPRYHSEGGDIWYEFGYAINPAASPKRIDIPSFLGPGYSPVHGIYELKGDELTIHWAFTPTGGEPSAPADFNPTEKTVLVTLKRVQASPQQKAAEKPASVQPPAVDPAAEWKALQGKWKVVQFKKGKESNYEDARLIMLDGRACEILGMEWRERLLKAYNIDPTKSPKTIDLLTFNSAGEGGELASHGIYEFDGERLKICLRTYIRALSSEQRPNSFAVAPDSGDACYVLERELPSADDKHLQGDWNVISDIEEGKSLAEDARRNLKLRFADHKTVKWQEASTLPCGGSYVLDPAKTPPRITIFTHDWRQTGNHYEPGSAAFIGIYRFDDDKLTIAYRKNGPAPEKFESTPGSGVTLLELKRSEPKPLTDAVPIPNDSKEKGGESGKPTDNSAQPNITDTGQPTDKSSIIAALKRRHAYFQSGDVTWSENRTKTVSKSPKKTGDEIRVNNDEIPIDRVRFVFEGEKNMYYDTANADYGMDGPGQPWQRYISAFNGSENRFYSPPGNPKFGHALGNIYSTQERYTDLETLSFRAIMLACRPLHPVLCDLDSADYTLVPEESMIEGHRCVELRETPQTEFPGHWNTFWLDRDRDDVIVKYESRYRNFRGKGAGGRGTSVNIFYQNDAVHGWVPSGWKSMWLNNETGAIYNIAEAKVTQYTFNDKIPPELFNLPFPPGTYVQDGKVHEVWVALPGGGKRVLTAAERKANLSYDELMRTKPGTNAEKDSPALLKTTTPPPEQTAHPASKPEESK